MVEQIVQITKAELDRLRRRELKLTCLEDFGVDSWEGYDEAVAAYHESTGFVPEKKEL